MQYCKVLGCNRTLLLAMMLYALYIALMLLCICVEPLVLALMLLCLCCCTDVTVHCVIVVLGVLEPVVWHMMLLCHLDSRCMNPLDTFCISFLQFQFRDSE